MDNTTVSTVEEELRWMHPRDIKFSQASISHVFRRILLKRDSEPGRSGASYAEALNRTQVLSLKATVQQLKDGQLKVTDIPSIHVVFHQERWYSLDNRRLWVFKEFGEEIPVLIAKNAEKEFFQKLSRAGDGDSVTFINEVEAKIYKENQTLSSHVLKWSLKEIMNERLLVNRVELIPRRFTTEQKYLAFYRWPLVEETRAQLQHAFENLKTASYITLKGIQEKTSGKDQLEGNLKTFMLAQDGTALIERRKKKGQPAWKPRPTDLILLANVVPENDYTELQRTGVLYTLGLLIGSSAEDSDTTFLKAEVYAPSESPEYRALVESNSIWFAIQLGNIATGLRIWEALHQYLPTDCSGKLNVRVITETLYTEVTMEGTPASNLFVGRPKETREEEIDSYCLYRELNKSQASAVKTSILGLLRQEKPHVRLIQGPPGTGKTSTLTTLLSILTSLNRRTLVCAPTNVAVSEVALRFLRYFDTIDPGRNNLQFGVFVKLHGMELQGDVVGPIQLGDIVLIGNKERLDVEGPLGRIYLDDRIDRLMIALSSVGGWLDSANAVVQFLSSAHEQYKTFRESLLKDPQLDSSFGEFLQNKLQKLTGDFATSSYILMTDLPSKYIPPRTIKKLESCLSLMATLLGFIESLKLKEADACLLFEKSSSCLTGPFSEDGGNMRQFLDTKKKLQQALNYVIVKFRCLAFPPRPSKKWLQELCLEDVNLVLSTVSSAGRQCVKKLAFQCVIVDEASQCVEAETLIVTSMRGLEQVILVGDHMQLPATVLSQVAVDCGYGRSIFERLQTLEHPSNLLNVQYRMHPAISSFPNIRFYGGKIQNGDNVLEETYGNKHYQKLLHGPYAVINISDGSEQREEGESTSWKNLVEVEIVLHLVAKIRNELLMESYVLAVCKDAKVNAPTIGIISPYRSQVENLDRRLQHISSHKSNIDVEVRSVDGFQGREKDLIIFSTVRSNSAGNIGFLEEYRRLNVAITRAKHCMWIVGNAHTLASKSTLWKALIENARHRKCYMQPDDDMTKVIRRVREELNQIADLLDPKSILFKDTLWKVVFAKDLKATITRLQSREKRQRLLYAMLNLAGGKRPRYSLDTKLASERFKTLIQVQPVGDLQLVWTMDVERWPEPKQIIKVWDAVDNSHLAQLIKRLEGGYSMCTQAYLDRCQKKKHDTRTNLVVPAKWSLDPSFEWYKSYKGNHITASISPPGMQDADADTALERSAMDESIRLMKFYSLSYSGIAHQLLTASNDAHVQLPFEVNEQEAVIVQYPRSSFIIGRSGTGKTTVITTKLLQREQAFWRATNGILGDVDGNAMGIVTVSQHSEVLKQVLITLSPKLCAAVKHNIAKTRRSMQAAEGGVVEEDEYEEMMLDDEAEAKLMGSIPDRFSNISNDCFPLVITFAKFLTMLDGSVAESFFSSTSRQPGSEPDLSQVGSIYEGDQPDLNSVNASSNKVDSDFSDEDHGYSSEEIKSENEGGSENEIKDCQEESAKSQRVNIDVDFERFASVYWPRFNSKLSRKFDPSLIYTEIMSQIKGSLEALQNPTGILSRSQYLAVAERRTSAYSREQRDEIYSLFLQYEKRKKEARKEAFEFDIADLVVHLYGQLQNQGYHGQKMHFVYVDEVQDFTLAQIALFKFICNNVDEGFMFAGDTAQTIARGVGFRFQDVRRLYYNEFLGYTEENQSTETEETNSAFNSSLEIVDHIEEEVKPLSKSDMGSTSDMKVPDLFHLSMNFRTHIRIVNIANSVVQLLHHFFPYSVDKLDPENSLLEGEVPVYLQREENCDLLTSLFDKGGWAGGSGCEFGAEQVILVRDSETKHRLVTRLGQAGLVLSVHECKGLEFQDVLLYNFFSDSPLRTKWRLIYSFLDQQRSSSSQTWSYPSFDVKRHNLLCSELKQLYVVLTRARQRLYIYDESEDNHQPMLDYWKSSGLVKIKCVDDSLAEELQGKSTAEDWRRRGVKMFNTRNYKAAFLCFERAGDTPKAQHAKAEDLQIVANNLQVTNPKEASRLICEAAEIYFSLQKGESAAKCYIKVGDYKKAASMYATVCKPPKLEDAGDCFIMAKCWKEAASAYFHVSISKCLDTCWRGKLLDLGVSFIEEQQRKAKADSCETQKRRDIIADQMDSLPQTTTEELNHRSWETTCKERGASEIARAEFLRNCASHFHQAKNVDRMMKFVLLFPSLAAQRSFLKRRDYNDQLLRIEEAAGNYGKAAELAEANGDLQHAAKMLEKAGSYGLAVEKLLHYVSMEIHWKNGAHGWPQGLTPETTQILKDAEALINCETSEVGVAALLHEIKILKSIGCDTIDVFRDNWERAQSLDNVRLQVVGSIILLQELVGRMRVNLDQDVDCLTGQVNRNLQSSKVSEMLCEHIPLLIQVWKQWSKHVIVAIHAIERLQKGRATVEDEPILEFVYSILGVHKHSQPHTLQVEDTNMIWLENACIKPIISSLKQNKRGQLSIKEFAPLALKFFACQLLETGLSGVSEVLEKLYTTLIAWWQPSNKSDLEKNPRPSTSALTQVLLDSFKVLRGVLEARTWDSGTVVLVKKMLQKCTAQFFQTLITLPQLKSMNEILSARESSDALLVFESLAVELHHSTRVSSGHAESHSSSGLTYDELGKLVMLMPFLGTDWVLGNSFKTTHNLLATSPADSFKLQLWRASQWQHRKVFHPSVLNFDMQWCSFWSYNLSLYIGALHSIFYNVDCRNETGYISTLVFLSLFERGVVATCAYATHLQNLILPQNLVMNYMAGKHHEAYYTMLLNSTCNNGCSRLSEVLLGAVNMILFCLFQVPQIEDWLHFSKLDKAEYLPVVTLRLISLLITICTNTCDGRIHRKVIQGLTILFQEQSPVLKDLPHQFLREFQSSLIGAQGGPVSILRLLSTFSRAMSSVDDPLILLRRTGRAFGMSWHSWALKNLRVVKVEIQSHGRQSSLNFDALRGAPETPSVKQSNMTSLPREVCEKEKRDYDLVVTNPCLEVQKQNPCTTEDADWEDEDQVRDTDFLVAKYGENSLTTLEDTAMGSRFSEIVGETQALQLQEIAPCSILSDRVTLEDGTTLPREFVEQLQKKLKMARDGLQVPWTPLERYQHEARSAFRQHHNKAYADFFILQACPLQVDLDAWLQKLHEALDYIKGEYERLYNQDDLLEKFSNHKETLEEAIGCLNPLSEKHQESNQRWLEEQVQDLKKLLEIGHIQLQGHLKKLLPPTDKDIVAEGASEEVAQECGHDKSNKVKQNQKQTKRKKKIRR